MAINESTIQDPQGDYDDWIEIFNPGDQQINLEGFYLTNDLSIPLQWAFPDTFVEPEGYFLIWADNDTSDPGLHTNFELSGDGEQVGFYDTDAHSNVLIDSITFTIQYPDTSFGRYPDGSTNWVFFSSPTPGYPNLLVSGCDFVPGDINGDDDVMGNDVTYGIRYFKGIGAPPPDSCWNDSTSSWLYSGGDANGNCTFTGSDVTFLVAFFKGHNPEILWCPQTPPLSPGYEHEEIRGDCIGELTADEDSSYMVLEMIGNDLHIHHMNAFYQCCLDYFVEYLIADYDITAVEHDLGEYCWCYCFFNLESILYNLREGFYTVCLIGIYGDTVGVDTVTVGGRY
jgi:hypothetical protein